VHIRPIRRTDEALLRDCFDRLGPASRRARFLGAKTVITPAETRYLTAVDHHDATPMPRPSERWTPGSRAGSVPGWCPDSPCGHGVPA
jgi:hypothetical protein